MRRFAWGRFTRTVQASTATGSVHRPFIEDTRSELNDGFHLLAVEPVESFHDVVDIRASFRIFENRRHRYAGSVQHPRSAYFARNAFNGGTLRTNPELPYAFRVIIGM